ncbi:MAG: DUF1376 domain-containing protein [Acidobacteriota bacterium]|nr:DUF1376 domain-containing protein [Acidobacteriota bacterium]
MDASTPYESPYYFPFYHRDFREGTLALPAAARGGYISLLIYQWDKKSIPGDDIDALGLIMGTRTRAEAKTVWASIGSKFVKGSDGAWRNVRMEEVRTEVEEFFERQRVNGKKGGRPPGPRGGKKPMGLAVGKPMGLPRGNPLETHTNTNTNTDPESGTQPRSEIVSSSADLSQPDLTVITSPSDAHASTVGNGWQVWVQIKELARLQAPRSLQWFEHVYAAHIVNGRLELYVEQPDMATWLMKHYTGTIGEGLAAAGQGSLSVRAIAKPRPVAKARAS